VAERAPRRPARGSASGIVSSSAVVLALRAGMEAGIVAGFAYWGYRAGGSAGSQTLLALAAPAVGFGIWSAVDFRRTGRLAEPLRLLEELGISGLAAVALFTAGRPLAGIALAWLSVVYHGLVHATGGRLLHARGPAPAGNDVAGGPEATDLTVEQRRTGTAPEIIFRGRINSASNARLAAAVHESLAQAPDAIRFDLRDSWIDSNGIALLLALYEECLQAGVRVETLPPPATREIFSRLGLPRRFRIEEGGRMVRVIGAGGGRG
jgi:anti-anti-sigma regulatory factor